MEVGAAGMMRRELPSAPLLKEADAAVLHLGGTSSEDKGRGHVLPAPDVERGAAFHRAWQGGLAGLVAGVAQVVVFMGFRTALNRQLYQGGSFHAAATGLWEEGGIARFYQGIGFAIVEVPLIRFGDTFANTWVLAILAGVAVPPFLKTVLVLLAAAPWRVCITPIDTLKTAMQVQGPEAGDVLRGKAGQAGLLVLWTGAAASVAAGLAGSYPWWATFNTLEAVWPPPATASSQVLRHGAIAICASAAADCASNGFRVLKTIRQAHPDASVGYSEAARQVVQQDGISSLMCRGLGPRLLINMVQGATFTITWKLLEHRLQRMP